MWDGCSGVHKKRLNSIYKRAVQIIDRRPIPSTDKFRHLNILGLHQQLTLNKCVFMHKILNNMTPQYLITKFISHQERKRTSRYNTLPLPLPRIDLFKTSMSFSGPFAWNSIPAHLKTITSPGIFKRKLSDYLMSQT